MDPRRERTPDQLGGVVAEDALDRGALVVDHAVDVDDRDHVGRVLGQRAEASLAAGDVLQRSTREGRHEGRQLLFLSAEKAADLAVDDVEARRGLALDLDRRTQRRPGPRQHEALARLSPHGLLRNDGRVGRDRPSHQGAAEVVDRVLAAQVVGAALGQLEDVATLTPQQGEGGVAHGLPHAFCRGGGGDPAPHLEEGREAVGQRKRVLGTGRVGLGARGRLHGVDGLGGGRPLLVRPQPTEEHSDLTSCPGRHGVLVARPLGVGDRQAAVERGPGAPAQTALRRDQAALPQCVGQVVAIGARDSARPSRDPRRPAQKGGPLVRRVGGDVFGLHAERGGQPWQDRRHILLAQTRLAHDASGHLESGGGLGVSAFAEQADGFGEVDFGGGVGVLVVAVELGGDEVGGHLSARGAGPPAQADAGGRPVADLHGVAVQPAGLVDGLVELAQAVSGERHVPAGGVHLPPVAGALQQTDGLSQLVE